MFEEARRLVRLIPFGKIGVTTMQVGNPIDGEWERCAAAVKLIETFHPTQGIAVVNYKGEPRLAFYRPAYLRNDVDLYSTDTRILSLNEVHPDYLEAINISVKEVQYA